MKFVSYIWFVLNLIMFRSFAHERENFVKNTSLCSWLCHLLVCPGDAYSQIVAILLVYVPILACCSALCIFEKHMLAFVDLIHALPTRGEEITQFMFL
jgi:hypothetical protein